jgi:hypothetical protein
VQPACNGNAKGRNDFIFVAGSFRFVQVFEVEIFGSLKKFSVKYRLFLRACFKTGFTEIMK